MAPQRGLKNLCTTNLLSILSNWFKALYVRYQGLVTLIYLLLQHLSINNLAHINDL